MSPKELQKKKGSDKDMSMYQRRKATQAELAQGEDEMRRAEARLAKERKSSKEFALEDVREEAATSGAAASSQEQTAIVGFDPAVGSVLERMPEQSPAAVPKALAPALPGSQIAAPPAEITDASLATRQPAEGHHVEEKSKDMLEDERPAQLPAMSEPRIPEAPIALTPGAGNLVQTPNQMTPFSPPLFTDDQLRRFQDLYGQAPLLYGMHALHQQQPTMLGTPMDPVRSELVRPLFLEQDEKRLAASAPALGSRSAVPVQAYPQMTEETQKMIQDLFQENERLRNRLDSLEDGSGKFATREEAEKKSKTKDKGKRRSKEADRPPKPAKTKEAERPPKTKEKKTKEVRSSSSSPGEESIHKTKEAARPPKPSKVEEAARPPKPSKVEEAART